MATSKVVSKHTFSIKKGLIGGIVGASIGLGLLNYSLCVLFGIAFALFFGFK
jgi:hypothetical protein